VFTIIRGNAAGWTSAPILASAAVALAGAAVVAIRQRAGHRLVPPEVLRSRALAASVLSLLALYVSAFGGFVYITLYLRTVCGLSPAATGGLLVVFAAASLATVLAVTRSARRDRLELLIPLALGVAAAGLLWIAAAAGSGSPWPLTPGLALLGIAAGVVNPLLTANQIGAFKPADGGIAAGLNGASRQFGTALGTALLGALVQAAIERRVTAAAPLDAASVQRIAAGDLGSGLAGAGARAQAAVGDAYRAGVTSGLRLALVAGAALLVLVIPLAARWLRDEGLER
jgi:predicted MFS family arabinose efflux permease